MASQFGRDLGHGRLGNLLLEVVAVAANKSHQYKRATARRRRDIQEFLVGVAEEGDGGTGLAGTTGTTDSVNVRLDRVGHLEVDDKGNVRDVDTTTGEIGRDEDVVLARPDRVERGFSLLLVLARVERDGVPLQDEEGPPCRQRKDVSLPPSRRQDMN